MVISTTMISLYSLLSSDHSPPTACHAESLSIVRDDSGGPAHAQEAGSNPENEGKKKYLKANQFFTGDLWDNAVASGTYQLQSNVKVIDPVLFIPWFHTFLVCF